MPHLLTVEGYAEENNALQSFLNKRTKESFEFVDAPTPLVRQGRNIDAGVRVICYKDGIHKH